MFKRVTYKRIKSSKLGYEYQKLHEHTASG